MTRGGEDRKRATSVPRSPKGGRTRRVPREIIEKVLKRTELEGLVAERATVRARTPDGIALAHCPFHRARGSDAPPTLRIDVSTGTVRCEERSCGFRASAIGWLMATEHMSFEAALHELGVRAGVVTERWIPHRVLQEEARKLSTLNEAVLEDYRTGLLREEPARRYLEERGFTQETVKRWRLGWADGSSAQIDHGRSDRRRRLWRAGLLYHDGRCRFRQRIVFPIERSDGLLVGFGARTIGQHEPKYLNSETSASFAKGRLLFGLSEALRRAGGGRIARLIVLEGYTDVLALDQAGIAGAVATLGTAMTESHLELAFAHADSVTLCFDGDPAGTDAARRAMRRILGVLRADRRLDFARMPDGHDPDSMVREHGADEARRAIGRTRSLAEMFVETVACDCDMDSIGGMAKFGAEAKRALKSVPDAALRRELRSSAEARIGLTLDDDA